jgi:nitronate monooxygenase
LSNSFTGAHAYYLRPSIEAAGLDPDNLAGKGKMDLTGAQTRIKAWKDIWSAGQGIGTINAIEPMSAIVDRMVEEYSEARSMP